MNDTFKVIVDPVASDRMGEHFEFLARVSKVGAERLLEELVRDMRSLEHMPYRNPIYGRPYLENGKYRYMMSSDRYRIVYQIEEGTVFVEDIQDCRQSGDNNLV